ncbi:phospho-sugar mutase [Halarcobacter ebronensis]|uniref:Phospho-sugar mutase n=1 Tax=Halarcobacter ebronensis TaxID=1462615 RepID=A0A4Q0YHL8_9BACT|nr:phosphomannomutase/phosphoglucomutase [Halarcobacter ebronensis]RXJ68589.1 phospho-sugar mutase [Halarcobacter ebronensis]
MINSTIFREYDIRGIVDSQLDEYTVKLIGYYFGKKVFSKYGLNSYIAVGYDAREHSTKLFSYLSSGLNKAKCQVLNMGMVATGINYFSNYQDFDIEGNKIQPCASIMITGSHNPKEYNGLKITLDKKPFFAQDIYNLRDEILNSFEMAIEDNLKTFDIDVKSLYINYMVKEFQHLKNLSDSFVIDCGNGVADTVLTQILDKLNLNYKGLYCKPDGTFPNHHPDPSEEKNLKDLKDALQDNFNYGFAYDGDADRVAFLTKKYNIKGDLLAILFAKKIKNPKVVGEVKCSQIMYDEINKVGKAIMYKAGHSNLKMKLKESNADFAVEVSGHIFFNDRFFGFDDGIYATFRILELIKDKMDIDKKIDSLPKIYSTEETKIKTTEEEKFVLMEKFKKLLKSPPKDFPKIVELIDIDGVRIVFEKGWALVRASNTTPILVTRFESSDLSLTKEYENKINNLIKVAKDEINSITN